MACGVGITGTAVALAIVSPWSSEPDRRDQPRVERGVDPLKTSRELVGGRARFTNCREDGRKRVCQFEGPTGKRAICFMYEGRRKGQVESYSCFDRYVDAVPTR